jgi:hypothetical protein
MKNDSEECGKAKETLPLEGGSCEKIAKRPPHPTLSRQGRG